ncbi:conserved hypothetical protein [Theileria orientalis strain Shintoku]|uniref:Uncharacterized protein n=1 Tax=Theileria orientalis strain Shintoku TaxID=869250 RepID=J4C8J2_THEOR|nr:conserved hypothetical protein [Theileria orientalis strain Shintoku]PVC53452.1 hypothetical protein MACL_00000077 [Theileria orientalis]BAM40883.1 conserved hypothetical protein [Theileria orientalis strain Shintoku]|eukprot:XP_009691184.1 conserved hypothetical protein [Theileria orientalis strain Shintoku]
MKVTTTTNNVLANTNKSKIDVDPGSLIQTYELNDYLNNYYKGTSFLEATKEVAEPGGVSNLQVSPEVKGLLKDKFWRTWYHLKHVQAGPFAVYNNPTPIDINGLFPATPDPVEHVAETAAVAAIGPPTVAGAAVNSNANNNLVSVAPGTNQVQVVPGVGPVSVVTQAPTTTQQNNNDELNRSLNAKAVPTELPVTTSPSGDPNTPPLANIPLVNVIGGKIISAPGVIPGEHMDNHPLFTTSNLDPTGYYKLNVENIGRTIIVVIILLFLVGGCVYRIKTRKRPKKKR